MHHNNDTGCWDVHCNTLWTCVRIFVIREREIGLPQNYQWPLAAKYQAIHNQRNICSRIFTDNSCSTVWHKMASRQPELSETFFSKQETVICSHKMKCKQIELKWNSDEDHRTLEFGGANCDHLMGAVDEQFNHLLLHFRLWSGVKMSPSSRRPNSRDTNHGTQDWPYWKSNDWVQSEKDPQRNVRDTVLKPQTVTKLDANRSWYNNSYKRCIIVWLEKFLSGPHCWSTNGHARDVTRITDGDQLSSEVLKLLIWRWIPRGFQNLWLPKLMVHHFFSPSSS